MAEAAMTNQTQWDVESAAMLAAGEWIAGADKRPLRLQDLADHYAAKRGLPQVMVRSTARELIKQRIGISVAIP